MLKNKKALTVSLPPKTLEQLKQMKELKQLSKSVLVQIALEEYLRKEKEIERP